MWIFCLETIFNLNVDSVDNKGFTILEKGLDFAPNQHKINVPELISDFNEFCRRMHLKWHFRDEPQGLLKHRLYHLNRCDIHLRDILA